MHEDPLRDAVERVAEYGGGTDEVWDVPESAVVKPGTGDHILGGAVTTHWTDDA